MAAFAAWPGHRPRRRAAEIISFAFEINRTEGRGAERAPGERAFPGWACVFYVGDGLTWRGAEAAGAQDAARASWRPAAQMLRFLPACEPGVPLIVRAPTGGLTRRRRGRFEWSPTEVPRHARGAARSRDGHPGRRLGRAVARGATLPDLYAQMRAFAASHATDKVETTWSSSDFSTALCQSVATGRRRRRPPRGDVVPRRPHRAVGLRRPARELPRQVRVEPRGGPHAAAGRRRARVVARIRHQPDAVAGVAAFLGGF